MPSWLKSLVRKTLDAINKSFANKHTSRNKYLAEVAQGTLRAKLNPAGKRQTALDDLRIAGVNPHSSDR